MGNPRAGAAVLCALLFAPSVSRCAVSSRHARVLVLYSASPDSATATPFEGITRPALEKKLGSEVDVYSEYLELQRFSSEEHQRELAAYITAHYSKAEIDLIVPVAFPALQFVRRYIAQALPNTPVVFVAVEARRIRGATLGPNVTGVVHIDDWAGALRSILQMQPRTREVVVVSGSAPTDHDYLEFEKTLFKPFESRVKFRYVADVPLIGILAIVSQLPSDAIVIQSAFAWDVRGQTFTDDGALKLLYRAANVPVYALVGRNLGQGFVGGPMAALQERYLLAADLAYRVLQGKKAATIPVETAHPEHAMAFDARQLARWHISEDRLPPGSLVAFRQPSPFARYKVAIIGVAALCLLETLLIAALLLQRSRRRQAERNLTESRNDVRSLAGRLIVAQEDERRRIGRELHDDLSQQLSAVSVLVSSLLRDISSLSPKAIGVLKQLQLGLTAAHAGIRSLSYELHPSLLQNLGLGAALQRHTQEFSTRTGITIHYQNLLEERKLPSEVALCLYRIAQEALRNIEKHSGVKEARVVLDYRDHILELLIVDHGLGFELADARRANGLGLTSMVERTHLINGDLDINTAPGKGTAIRARIPDTPSDQHTTAMSSAAGA